MIELTYTDLGSIFVGQNPRQDVEEGTQALYADMAERGLITPPITWRDPEKKNGANLEMLCGHRRFLVLNRLRKSEPEVWKKHFPDDKIPVLVMSGISRERAQTIKVDSGTTVELSDPFEAQLCANILFDDGATESAVANSLSALLSRSSRGGMKKEVKLQLDTLQTERENARKEGKLSVMQAKDREIFILTAQYHRGHVQMLHDVYRCPAIVMACREFEATAICPKGYKSSELMRLTGNDVKRLYAAFQTDLAVKDGNELPKYSKLKPGENFKNKYAEIKDAKKKGGNKKSSTDPVKSMSSKAIMTEVNDSLWQSIGFRLLAARCAGVKSEVSTIKAYDYIAFIAENLRESFPKDWEKLTTKVEKTLKEKPVTEGKEK